MFASLRMWSIFVQIAADVDLVPLSLEMSLNSRGFYRNVWNVHATHGSGEFQPLPAMSVDGRLVK